MIILLLFNFLIAVLSIIFGFFGDAYIRDLPVIGSVVASSLEMAVMMFNSFAYTFPYVTPVFQTFLYIILPFEVSVKLIKFFLGNRSPVNTN